MKLGQTLMKDAFDKYKNIQVEIDGACNKLHLEHHEHTKCRQGCDSCCMNFDVLPVEFFSIHAAIKDHPPKLNLKNGEQCLFLVDHSCQIYEYRPSICRSHGLPILNMDDEGENWELSFCPLNFTGADEEYFTLENGFQQDVFNSKLYLANREFVKEFEQGKYSENELIELRSMKDFL